jgi:hypothetical protein
MIATNAFSGMWLVIAAPIVVLAFVVFITATVTGAIVRRIERRKMEGKK